MVGVDTGKTAALACIDLDGNVICLDTARFAGLGWFVDRISKAGIPVVIAGDKARSNPTAGKIATIFDSVLFTPSSDISVRRKNEMLGLHPAGNVHERDALSAALTAYNSYRNKLGQTERRAKEKRFGDVDGLKALVIRKYSAHDVMARRKSGRRLVR